TTAEPLTACEVCNADDRARVPVANRTLRRIRRSRRTAPGEVCLTRATGSTSEILKFTASSRRAALGANSYDPGDFGEEHHDDRQHVSRNRACAMTARLRRQPVSEFTPSPAARMRRRLGAWALAG